LSFSIKLDYEITHSFFKRINHGIRCRVAAWMPALGGVQDLPLAQQKIFVTFHL